MPRPRLPFKDFEWTPELAYAVGLIATDGNLSKDGRHIALRSSDRELLKTFQGCLALRNTKIARTRHDGYARRPCYRVQFSNVQLYAWLVAIGLMPAKTRRLGALRIPDECFRDFLRGHLDGDGSIITYRDFYNAFKNPKYVYTRLSVKFCSASQAHIGWLRETAFRLLGVRGQLVRAKPDQAVRRGEMWWLKFGKYESLKLLKWLYHHRFVPCLERKREIADRFLAQQGSVRRVSVALPS